MEIGFSGEWAIQQTQKQGKKLYLKYNIQYGNNENRSIGMGGIGKKIFDGETVRTDEPSGAIYCVRTDGPVQIIEPLAPTVIYVSSDDEADAKPHEVSPFDQWLVETDAWLKDMKRRLQELGRKSGGPCH